MLIGLPRYAADQIRQYWETYLGIQCRLHELREKERISVAAASKYLANLVYSYKGVRPIYPPVTLDRLLTCNRRL